MSIINDKSGPARRDSRVLYGWRPVERLLPDGTSKQERIPLTLEDVLHPKEDDVIPNGDLHIQLRAYLFLALRYKFRNDPSVKVFSNMLIRWRHPQFETHCVDVAIIFGIKEVKPVYESFDVQAEGVKPRLVIEITVVRP